MDMTHWGNANFISPNIEGEMVMAAIALLCVSCAFVSVTKKKKERNNLDFLY